MDGSPHDRRLCFALYPIPPPRQQQKKVLAPGVSLAQEPYLILPSWWKLAYTRHLECRSPRGYPGSSPGGGIFAPYATNLHKQTQPLR